ncbi:uncharacterized protein LOC6585721 [Drosophila mojavensis]|uniref:DUF4773 domain-containing protein n=1 Tax=Drosophila mojavensis TaxID=7230 RepID=B4L744_DROMO|nr:uncharacterized protein LOC6585721 [Drosophila mojavensis]EDW06190.1 uncharacterized protein Dmoj_GI16481 [Drosophila mojavensis]
MVHALARPLLLMLLVGSALLSVESKTLNRRTDKISENFKQLDLPPEEIDPNVAPPEPQKLETAVAEAAAETVAEPAAATTAAAATGAADAAEAVDEAANEIASADAAAAAPVTEAAVAKPKPKPTKPTKQDDNPISRFCKCTESHCDCCRKFGLPLLPSGPGCAKIAYLGNDEMSVSLKFGDITLASRRISSKRARPICVSMPGGYSKFCGRVYGLSRAQENFKACLAFELRSDDELEAQLPISCFKFGSEGLRVAEAEPLPTKVKKPEEDDDDDIFGFGAGDDEDEDEDDDYDDGETTGASAEDDDADDYAEDDDTEAPEDADYGGFSLGGLLDELDDDEDEKPIKKPAVAAAATPLADQTTREHVEMDAQSKDEAGTVVAAAAAAPAATDAPATVAAAVEAAAAPAVAAAEDSSSTATTTSTSTSNKNKKSKKAKKNKKKKKAANDAAAGEGDFAYELLNGILDFFN